MKTRGACHLPAVRACGEGVYMIVTAQTYLAYQLELPTDLGDVQTALNLKEKGNYVLSVKNQAEAGIRGERKAEYPKRLQKRLGNLRFVAANPIELLNYAGVELLIIGSEGICKSASIYLNQLLANEYFLYLKTLNFHWNITGENFIGLHQLLELQYE